MRLFLALLFISAAAQASGPALLQVQGRCEIKVMPDRGMITFTVENQTRDQAEAVKKTLAQMEAFKTDLKKMGLADLELHNGSYQVTQIRDYEKNKYVDRGYLAALSLEVTTSDLARLAETTLLASKHKIKNVGSLATFLSLEKNRSEYLKCLDLAAEDARGKANQLAKKLNFKVGDVYSIVEAPAVSAQPPAYMLKSMMADASAAPRLETSEQVFSTQLSVSFTIK